MKIRRCGYKIYIWVPWLMAEVQIGLRSRSIRLWYRKKLYTIIKGRHPKEWLK